MPNQKPFIKDSYEMVLQNYLPSPVKDIPYGVKNKSKAMEIIQSERDEYLSDSRMNMGFVIVMLQGKLIHQKPPWEEHGNYLEKMPDKHLEEGGSNTQGK